MGFNYQRAVDEALELWRSSRINMKSVWPEKKGRRRDMRDAVGEILNRYNLHKHKLRIEAYYRVLEILRKKAIGQNKRLAILRKRKREILDKNGERHLNDILGKTP